MNVGMLDPGHRGVRALSTGTPDWWRAMSACFTRSRPMSSDTVSRSIHPSLRKHGRSSPRRSVSHPDDFGAPVHDQYRCSEVPWLPGVRRAKRAACLRRHATYRSRRERGSPVAPGCSVSGGDRPRQPGLSLCGTWVIAVPCVPHRAPVVSRFRSWIPRTVEPWTASRPALVAEC